MLAILTKTKAAVIFSKMESVNSLAKTKAAMIFSKSTDCMSHSIETLFHELGASPGVHELDHDPKGWEMEWALQKLGCNPTVPAVFIGGTYLGSAGDVFADHLNGSLKDRLKSYLALAPL